MGKERGVKHIVKLSHIRADLADEPQINITRLHRQAEKIIEESGIPFIFLISYNLYLDKNQSSIYLPAGNGKVSFVDVRDIAAVAVQALIGNEKGLHISVISMNVLDFAGEVILLSASGVLSPGPLFVMNLVYGSKQGYRAGLKIASGHAIIEFPLIIILTISFFQLTNTSIVTYNLNVLGLAGGTSIIIFAIIQIINTARKERSRSIFNNSNKNYRVSFIADKPVLSGIIFSALNPFFIAWWLTVGLTLISDSISLFGVVTGSILLFLFHIWMDYVWLIITSYLISKGVSIIKIRYYYFLLVGLNIILTFYGMYMIVSSILFIM